MQLQAAQKVQTFLLEASAVLTAASGYRETLERLAALAVPALGDVCYIDVVNDEGKLARVVARHANAEMQDIAAQLGREYPPGANHPSSDAIRTRRSVLVSNLPADLRDGMATDERHRQLLRTLGVTSYMIVPLVTGGTALGAVTLAVTTSGRRF